MSSALACHYAAHWYFDTPKSSQIARKSMRSRTPLSQRIYVYVGYGWWKSLSLAQVHLRTVRGHILSQNTQYVSTLRYVSYSTYILLSETHPQLSWHLTHPAFIISFDKIKHHLTITFTWASCQNMIIFINQYRIYKYWIISCPFLCILWYFISFLRQHHHHSVNKSSLYKLLLQIVGRDGRWWRTLRERSQPVLSSK